MAAPAHEFNIEMNAIPKKYVKDILRALLHSIFFHRLLVNVIPKEICVLETTISITDSTEVERLIEDRISEFMQNVNYNNSQHGKIAVLFYEKRLKKNWFQFSKSEELVCWEQWVITLHLSDQDRPKASESVSRQLAGRLLDILKKANDNKEHIPSITTTEGNPFPYQIAIPSRSESWGAMIKRMLVTDAPSSEGGDHPRLSQPPPSVQSRSSPSSPDKRP